MFVTTDQNADGVLVQKQRNVWNEAESSVRFESVKASKLSCHLPVGKYDYAVKRGIVP